MSEFKEQCGVQNENIRDELNLVLERLNHSSQQLTDVKRQVAITGRVIDLYWKLESKSITPQEYQSQLMTILQEW